MRDAEIPENCSPPNTTPQMKGKKSAGMATEIWKKYAYIDGRIELGTGEAKFRQ